MNRDVLGIIALALLVWSLWGPAIVPSPEPQPDPNPDVDVIDDSIPAPIPGPGNSVLIIEEQEDRRHLTTDQLAILGSVELREFCEANQIDLRIWDQHIEFEHDDPKWRLPMQSDRTSLPWIYVSNGKTGFSGPLPKDLSATKELIGRFL